MTDLDFNAEQTTPLLPDSRPIIIGYQSAQHMMNTNCNAPYQVGSRRHRHRYSESSDIPRPNNNIILAVSALFCSICCFPALFCAIIAMIYSLQVNLSWDMGHHARAHSAAEKARKCAVGPIVAGVCVFTGLTVFLCVHYEYLREPNIIRALAFMEHL